MPGIVGRGTKIAKQNLEHNTVSVYPTFLIHQPKPYLGPAAEALIFAVHRIQEPL
jgi:hypothetical protein